jgi:parallel beta-helix repeat protein
MVSQESLTESLFSIKLPFLNPRTLELMRKKALAVAVVFILSVLVWAGLQVSHIATANFIPETPPSGIEITSAGTVKGTDLIQQSGNIYTLTGNIKGTIVVQCDGIVLDGAGYSVEGNGSGVGVFLQARNDVVIKNMKISNFDFGIKLTWLGYGFGATRGKTISGNTLINNTYGIYINDFSTGNKLLLNTVIKNEYGIWLDSSCNNTLRDNRMSNNDFNFFVSGGTVSSSINDVDQSNTVNGAPVVYWVNQEDRLVPADAGYIALINCTKMTVKNFNLAHNGQAMLLVALTDSIIANNVVSQNHNGIWLIRSQNNQIEENTISNNAYDAFYISGSNSNRIFSNHFADNGFKGISIGEVLSSFGQGALRLMYSSNNFVSSNIITGNGEGINIQESRGNTVSANVLEGNRGSAVHLFDCTNNSITNNKIVGNNDCGIKLWMSNQNQVFSNLVSNNSLGILLDEAAENSILQNNVVNNSGFGLQLKSANVAFMSSTNNTILHNNFVENQPEGLDVSIPGTMNRLSPELVPGPGNTWDDGREGNYWSDYLSRYPNASEIDHMGTGDTPYFINENNIDNHPLMSPSVVSVDLSSSSSSTTTSEDPAAKPPIENQTETELPLSLPLISSIVAIFLLVIVGLLIYFKKRSGIAISDNRTS